MAYSISDYNADRQYIEKHDSLPKDSSPESKLDVLVNSGLAKLFVNCSGIIRSPRGCIFAQVALGMLQDDAVMARKIHEKNGLLPEGEKRELVKELYGEISKRANELFDEKYRGAKARVARYDRKQNSLKQAEPVEQIPETVHVPVQRYLFG